MVRYFKINDPYRLLALFLFVIATRIAVVFVEHPFTSLHSSYFDSESHLVYGTLFLWITWAITFIFGDPFILSVVLSGLLITVQAFFLNSILIRSKGLNQNTYLPAACYVLILSASPEFMLVSPALFSITFILIGINYMLFHLQYGGSEENIISTGFVFGLATLFDPSSAILILLPFVVYILYSNTLFRRYVLLTFGLIFPYLLIWLYSFWQGDGLAFWVQTANNLFNLDFLFLIPWTELIILAALPLFINVISAAQTFTGVNLTVNQIVTQKTLLLLGFFSFIALFLNTEVSATSIIYFVPTMAFFIAQFLLTRERKWFSEVVFILLLIWSLAFLLLPILQPEALPISYDALR